MRTPPPRAATLLSALATLLLSTPALATTPCPHGTRSGSIIVPIVGSGLCLAVGGWVIAHLIRTAARSKGWERAGAVLIALVFLAGTLAVSGVFFLILALRCVPA